MGNRIESKIEATLYNDGELKFEAHGTDGELLAMLTSMLGEVAKRAGVDDDTLDIIFEEIRNS